MPNRKMTDVCRLPDWSHLLTDHILDHLAVAGWCVLNAPLPIALYTALCVESQQSTDYQVASLAHGVQSAAIRRDHIRWLEPTDPAGADYLMALETLATALNRALYLGIQRVEAHYACYESGQFYAIHRDNPSGSQARAISTVLYLNSVWQPDFGGALRLEDRHGQWQTIWPMGQQWVIFDSHLRHEVQPASQTRRSIAGWLRRD